LLEVVLAVAVAVQDTQQMDKIILVLLEQEVVLTEELEALPMQVINKEDLEEMLTVLVAVEVVQGVTVIVDLLPWVEAVEPLEF
jgi:hypothetical protein